MLSETKCVGNLNELACMYGFMSYGITCSIPYGDGEKYDFIADVKGDMLRIQCKSAEKVDNNSFIIRCTRQTTNSKRTIRYNYSKNDIDYFATYYGEVVYVFPVEECNSSKTFRYSPPMNTNIKYYLAEDYSLENFLKNKYNIKYEHIANSNNVSKEYYCENCGKLKSSKHVRFCIDCYEETIKKVKERPSREELKQMIRKRSFLSIAKSYKVSDNAIRKWCKAYNLPFKKTEIKKISDEEWGLI